MISAHFTLHRRRLRPQDVKGYARFVDYARRVFEAGYQGLADAPFLRFSDMVRVAPDRYETLLKKPHAQEMDFTGKPLKGFLFISDAGYRTASGLASWLDEAIECAKAKPPKKRKLKRAHKST